MINRERWGELSKLQRTVNNVADRSRQAQGSDGKEVELGNMPTTPEERKRPKKRAGPAQGRSLSEGEANSQQRIWESSCRRWKSSSLANTACSRLWKEGGKIHESCDKHKLTSKIW
ncbi:hypothetical protein DACRYDRAFT_23080 [Dacryopinax primogenitus]|uniref:Uncharacterized protein n=1 Tax=Dacryopinax primogenitus (strain DJM 731) TaxID=1858805 RepID=M5G4H4_DACPD|nr:uncharacterized protein DACRYDRAFT_23080 [Dacryopinax primogenitus]EJU00722.1 hypothetical protein DACRYDRAFT_23080 [Dacryopinax primogenitus]